MEEYILNCQEEKFNNLNKNLQKCLQMLQSNLSDLDSKSRINVIDKLRLLNLQISDINYKATEILSDIHNKKSDITTDIQNELDTEEEAIQSFNKLFPFLWLCSQHNPTFLVPHEPPAGL